MKKKESKTTIISRLGKVAAHSVMIGLVAVASYFSGTKQKTDSGNRDSDASLAGFIQQTMGGGIKQGYIYGEKGSLKYRSNTSYYNIDYTDAFGGKTKIAMDTRDGFGISKDSEGITRRTNADGEWFMAPLNKAQVAILDGKIDLSKARREYGEVGKKMGDGGLLTMEEMIQLRSSVKQ